MRNIAHCNPAYTAISKELSRAHHDVPPKFSASRVSHESEGYSPIPTAAHARHNNGIDAIMPYVITIITLCHPMWRDTHEEVQWRW